MTDPLAHAERTATGRVVLYAVGSGKRYERGDDQARDMLASGQFALRHQPPAPEHTADTPTQAIAPAVVVAPSGTPGRRRRSL